MPRETADEVDRGAADWAARVDRGLSPEEDRALEDWLAADPRRAGAYAKARGAALYTERARALGSRYDPDRFQPRPPRAPVSRRGLLAGGAIAAGLAGVAVVGLAWGERGQRLSTRLGEVRVVPLEDGSVMTLNTASRAEVVFSEGERRIRLLEGEALFDVAKDAGRPFVVDAGGALVRAIGTSFTVRRLGPAPVEVLVREGVVEMKTRGAAAGQAAVRVTANTRALAMHGAASIVETTAVAPDAVGRELAWRDGRIAFEGETLREAALQFARYSDTRIVIDDPGVAAEEITGLFQANDPVGFARAVATSFGLHTEIRAGEVRLSRPA